VAVTVNLVQSVSLKAFKPFSNCCVALLPYGYEFMVSGGANSGKRIGT